jgi:hypothetical protein
MVFSFDIRHSIFDIRHSVFIIFIRGLNRLDFEINIY